MDSTTHTDTGANRIWVLPADLANKIAAGEVVERPASVVKELVENAIDAGAIRIKVEIESAGKKLIRVSDDGHGMSRQDARLAFERHATSKIRTSEDLEGILTLGFRGEALPSIASVAKVRLTSNDDERHSGAEIRISGGGAMEVSEIACPRGTVVEVGQLFFNTPARRKFLKGDTTEASHITQVMTQTALAHPHIHMTLIHNDRQVLTAAPTEQSLYRIAELFGSELAKQLVEVDERAGSYHLRGFVSNPVFTRSSRSAQYFFINGRFVRDKVVLHAAQMGYSHLLPREQHAILFLHLSMDPKLVDVNVHPAKAEVRFAFQQEVHRFVADSIRRALSRNAQMPAESATSPVEESEPNPAPLSVRSPAGTEQNRPSLPPSAFMQPENRQSMLRAIETFYKGGDEGQSSFFERRPSGQKGCPRLFDQKPIPVSNLVYSEFEPLGQLDSSFIVLQGRRGLIVVDQHVAHERILYERFREAARNKKVDVQQLLFPLSIEFAPDEAELLTSNLERLRGLGFDLEPFGGRGFLLRSVPALIKNSDHAAILHDIAEALPRGGSAEVVRDKLEEIVIMMACRNAVTINQPLDLDQIRKLIHDLERTEMPYTCPHGRPIALFFDLEEMLKSFLRK
jgi:DNA mismatch repair protein MutL